MWSTQRRVAAGLVAALLLVACGAAEEGEPVSEPAPEGPEAPQEEDCFDRERSRELAEGYLGVAEAWLEQNVGVRGTDLGS